MARPRRSEQTRQDLLDLGVSLLAEKGYNGTGIKEILDLAKVPKGSFYNFFASKEEFAVEIISHYADDLFAKMDALISSAGKHPASEVLKTIQLAAFITAESDDFRKTCLIGSLASEIAASSEACRTQLIKINDQWLERLERLILRGQEEGEFRKDISAEVMAGLFWNQWQGALLRLKVEKTAEGAKQTLDALFKLLYIADS